MKIAEISVRRPVFAVMLIGALVVMGLVSIPRLGVDLFPRVEFPMVTVTTVLEGAAPEAVEREVTQPLEEAINTIEGIRNLRSVSSESHSQIMIEFGLDHDARQKAQDVRDKVFAARAQLPVDAEPPVVDRIDPDAEPILSVLVAGTQDIRHLTELADKQIKARLERLTGVGQVTVVGGRAREVRIWLDPLRLTGYGLAVEDVLGSLQRGHVETPGGRISTDRLEYTVKTRGKLERVEDFGDLIVSERDGRLVALRDVANVEDGMAEERTIARLDGRRGVSLLVRRQSGANIVAVSERVKDELRGIESGGLPPGVEMIIAQDTARFIESSVHDVTMDLLWGGLLAVLVVLAFLRSARTTLICATAIPTSLVASFALFYFLGFTLNNMTLMALSLSIGMLIDDAICVLENIHRHVENGTEPRQAALDATREIGLAVIATTLAICAVFVPIAFMGSMIGKFFREFGLVVACAVCVSTLVAVTLTPMLCSRLLRRETEHGRTFRALERGYQTLERRYRAVLGWGLRHRGAVVALAGAAIVAGGLLAREVPFDLMMMADRSEMNVWLKAPLGTPPQKTQATVERLEASLLALPDVTHVFARIGGGARERVNEANLYVKLVHKSQRGRTQVEIMDEVRSRVDALALPIDEYAVEEIPWISVAGARFYALAYAIRGPDHATLGRTAQQLVGYMEQAGGFVDVTSTFESGRPEITLAVSRGRAADLGISASHIGGTLASLMGGVVAGSFEEGGSRYDVRVQVLPEYRDDPTKLGLAYVRAPSGALISLANLVQPAIEAGPVQIERENRARVVTVQANLAGKPLGIAADEVQRFVAGLELGDQYEVAPVGQTENMLETAAAIGFAFLLAMIAMYMILASQFDSFLHPLTIMLSAPLSFVGAFAALALGGYTLGMMSQIGLLMLMGLVMKNGILLVDYTNTLRERGHGLHEAVLEAAPTRLRPVLMTAISTIFGMMPVVIGRGDGAEWRSSMGVIVVGGMAASTLLTLLVVPVAYTLVEDGRSAVGRRLRRLGDVLAHRPAPEPGPAPRSGRPRLSGPRKGKARKC